jgi:hypothetical protein
MSGAFRVPFCCCCYGSADSSSSPGISYVCEGVGMGVGGGIMSRGYLNRYVRIELCVLCNLISRYLLHNLS